MIKRSGYFTRTVLPGAAAFGVGTAGSYYGFKKLRGRETEKNTQKTEKLHGTSDTLRDSYQKHLRLLAPRVPRKPGQRLIINDPIGPREQRHVRFIKKSNRLKSLAAPFLMGTGLGAVLPYPKKFNEKHLESKKELLNARIRTARAIRIAERAVGKNSHVVVGRPRSTKLYRINRP